MPNKDAVKVLEDWGFGDAERIVSLLIDNKFIEEIALTEPEILAEGAKTWLRRYGGQSSQATFEKASGWGTDSWRVVMEEISGVKGQYTFDTPRQNQSVFAALVILAQEAGIDL